MQSQLSTLPVPTSSLFWKGGAIDALEAGQGDSSRAVHGVQFHLAYNIKDGAVRTAPH
jgi:hypothetical protein